MGVAWVWHGHTHESQWILAKITASWHSSIEWSHSNTRVLNCHRLLLPIAAASVENTVLGWPLAKGSHLRVDYRSISNWDEYFL